MYNGLQAFGGLSIQPASVWASDVKYLMSLLAEALYYLWLVGVLPET